MIGDDSIFDGYEGYGCPRCRYPSRRGTGLYPSVSKGTPDDSVGAASEWEYRVCENCRLVFLMASEGTTPE